MRILSAISCLFLAAPGLASTVTITGATQDAAKTNTDSATTPTTAADQAPTTAANNTNAASSLAKCKTDMAFLLDTAIEPLEQFNQYLEYCYKQEVRVPNGVKVASCFHSGYFMMRTLRPMANEIKEKKEGVQENFDTYINSFCEKSGEVLPKRTEFVKAISSIEDSTEFTAACFKLLEETPTLNVWFDPIDPIASVTQQEICDLHFKLFDSLREKQRTSIAEFVSFSYLASLDLFLNAYQQEDYENCVNMDVIEQPNQWITEFITSHPALLIWKNQDKLDIAAVSGTDITNKCADQATCRAAGTCDACDGCSHGIARVYRTFELYLNTMFADKFRDYSETMFNKLHEANLALETN